MGSSSSRTERRSNAVNSSHPHTSQPTRGSSSGRRRARPEQMQSNQLAFTEIVTFNPIFSHKECFLRQLNWWILDGKLRSGHPFRLNQGGPAGPAGECGSAGVWNYCTLSKQYQFPAPYRDIAAAAADLDIQGALSQAIQTAVSMAHEQPFEDANARTAILYMVERLSHQGLAVRTDIDLFSIYAHLKSMSATANSPPPEDVVGMRIINILGMATRKAPVTWADRMCLADRIKVQLHAEVLEVQLYYKELQKLSEARLKARLRTDKEQDNLLYSRWRLLFPRPTALQL